LMDTIIFCCLDFLVLFLEALGWRSSPSFDHVTLFRELDILVGSFFSCRSLPPIGLHFPRCPIVLLFHQAAAFSRGAVPPGFDGFPFSVLASFFLRRCRPDAPLFARLLPSTPVRRGYQRRVPPGWSEVFFRVFPFFLSNTNPFFPTHAPPTSFFLWRRVVFVLPPGTLFFFPSSSLITRVDGGHWFFFRNGLRGGLLFFRMSLISTSIRLSHPAMYYPQRDISSCGLSCFSSSFFFFEPFFFSREFPFPNKKALSHLTPPFFPLSTLSSVGPLNCFFLGGPVPPSLLE